MLNRIVSVSAIAVLFMTLALTGCETTKKTTSSAKSTIGKAADAAIGGDYYAEETGTDGRLYVFGSADEHEKFKAGNVGELWDTAILAGPNGETIKFEVSKDGPELQARLRKTFAAKHGVKL